MFSKNVTFSHTREPSVKIMTQVKESEVQVAQDSSGKLKNDGYIVLE